METSGVSGSSSAPEKVPGIGKPEGSGDMSGLMHAKVATLGQLKAVLVQYMGEQQGTKFYNQFMTSFAMIMLQQIQDSAQKAQQASQNMRMDVH